MVKLFNFLVGTMWHLVSWPYAWPWMVHGLGVKQTSWSLKAFGPTTVWSGYAILPFVQQRHQHIDSMTRAFGQYAFAMLVFLIFTSETNWDLTQVDWIYLAILGVICTVVAHTLWLRATTMLPPTNSSLIFYLGSPIAMVTSYIFLNEEMSSNKVLGACLIISANVFGVLMRKKTTPSPSLNKGGK